MYRILRYLLLIYLLSTFAMTHAYAQNRVLSPDGDYVPTMISGVITDESGQPIPNASVRLEQDGKEIAQKQADTSGTYWMMINHGVYDLFASSDVKGVMLLGISLDGGTRTINLTLKEAVSVEGTLLMLDDKTPHVAAVVQAVIPPPDGEGEPMVVDTALSDESGLYQLINLKPGQYQVRCQSLGGYVYYGEEKARGRGSEEAGERGHGDILRVESGKTVRDTDFRFAPLKKGTWKNYNTLDGLASDNVFDIHRAPDGVMWFATLSGITRYDGKDFVSFTRRHGLAGNWVLSIHSGPDGVMWLGTKSNGASRYDGKGFINFTTEDGLAHNDVWAICRASDGIMWFGTDDGLSRYDGKEFVNFTRKDGLAGNAVMAMYRAPDGVVWFGTAEGVSRYDGREFVNFTTSDGLVHNIVWAIDRAPDGIMWFGTQGGLSRYDGKGFINFTKGDGLASNTVSCIQGDPDGVMWFGTGWTNLAAGSGVSRYDPKGFVNFTTKDGLPGDTIDIYCGMDGVMWFATSGQGVFQYDSRGMGDSFHFVNFTTESGLAHYNVWAIDRDPDGVMWFGTRGGLSRYDGKEFVNFTTEDGLRDSFIRDLHVGTKGVIWLATDYGVSRYDGGDKGDSPHLLATRQPKHRFVNFTEEDGLVYNRVRAVYGAPDGVMWFAATDLKMYGGASRYDGKKFVNFTVEDGLTSNLITDICGDLDGVIWFGSWDGGVSRYDGREFTGITTEDGLAHNTVMGIYCDPDGTMWFGTIGGGVSWYDGFAWTSLDTRDGLVSNAVTSIQQDSEGYLWFGGMGGVTRYRRNTTPPRVHIVSVTTDKTYRDLSTIPAFMPETRVTIKYDSVDLKTILEKRQYRYRLSKKEIDMDWSRPTKVTLLDHTFDEPGSYIFEVQAIDRDLNYSEPASVEIVVSGIAFYRTGVFTAMMSTTGGVLMIVVILLIWQHQKASQVQRELERSHKMAEQVQEAKMLSLRQLVAGVAHQMNNPIGTLASNNDVSSRAVGQIQEIITEHGIQKIERNRQLTRAFTVLEKIKEGNQSASDGIARTVTDLRSFVRLDEAEWQLADIHESMNTVLDLMKSEFSDRIKIARDYGDIPRIYCSPSSLNQVFMSMFRNACEAIEGEGEVRLRTSAQEEIVMIEISDTGRGIPAENVERVFDPGFTTKGVKVGVGLGLSICYQIIVDEHKGRIDVSSEPGKGARFTIILPKRRDEIKG